MKYGLMLPNGRNSCGLSSQDIHFHKHSHLPKYQEDMKTRLHLQNESKKKLNKLLDNWKMPGYNHKRGERFIIKLKAG